MSERLERAGRAVVDHPVSAPTETAELERRVSRRRTRRAASIVACVALVGLAGATVVALNGGDDEATQPIVTDGSQPTVPGATAGLSTSGVLIRDGATDTAIVHNLTQLDYGTVPLPEPLDPTAQYFVREGADGALELDARTTWSGVDDEACTYARRFPTDPQVRVCESSLGLLDADGNETPIVGRPADQAEGHWSRAIVSPDGQQALAEWVGACDSPTTYFVRIDGSDVKAATGPDLASAPVGWVDDDSAVVTTAGRCGEPADAPMGVVAITPASTPTVIYEAEHPDDFSAALWTRLDDAGTPATQSARRAWDALDASDYSFDFQAQCYCDNLPMHVTVVDNEVASVGPVDGGTSGRSLDGATELSTDLVKTVPQLLDLIVESELNREAGIVDARYDERGVPLQASIDTIRQAIDDEYAWTITNVVIGT